VLVINDLGGSRWTEPIPAASAGDEKGNVVTDIKESVEPTPEQPLPEQHTKEDHPHEPSVKKPLKIKEYLDMVVPLPQMPDANRPKTIRNEHVSAKKPNRKARFAQRESHIETTRPEPPQSVQQHRLRVNTKSTSTNAGLLKMLEKQPRRASIAQQMKLLPATPNKLNIVALQDSSCDENISPSDLSQNKGVKEIFEIIPGQAYLPPHLIKSQQAPALPPLLEEATNERAEKDENQQNVEPEEKLEKQHSSVKMSLPIQTHSLSIEEYKAVQPRFMKQLLQKKAERMRAKLELDDSGDYSLKCLRLELPPEFKEKKRHQPPINSRPQTTDWKLFMKPDPAPVPEIPTRPKTDGDPFLDYPPIKPSQYRPTTRARSRLSKRNQSELQLSKVTFVRLRWKSSTSLDVVPVEEKYESKLLENPKTSKESVHTVKKATNDPFDDILMDPILTGWK
jgi:hypothetical protein